MAARIPNATAATSDFETSRASCECILRVAMVTRSDSECRLLISSPLYWISRRIDVMPVNLFAPREASLVINNKPEQGDWFSNLHPSSKPLYASVTIEAASDEDILLHTKFSGGTCSCCSCMCNFFLFVFTKPLAPLFCEMQRQMKKKSVKSIGSAPSFMLLRRFCCAHRLSLLLHFLETTTVRVKGISHTTFPGRNRNRKRNLGKLSNNDCSYNTVVVHTMYHVPCVACSSM